MGQTTYRRIKIMIDNLLSNDIKEISDLDMTATIAKFIGSDPRTLQNAINLMMITGLVKKTPVGFKLKKVKDEDLEREMYTRNA